MQIIDKFWIFPFGITFSHFDSAFAYNKKRITFGILPYNKIVFSIIDLMKKNYEKTFFVAFFLSFSEILLHQ